MNTLAKIIAKVEQRVQREKSGPEYLMTWFKLLAFKTAPVAPGYTPKKYQTLERLI
jgi:hypothetical protein